MQRNYTFINLFLNLFSLRAVTSPPSSLKYTVWVAFFFIYPSMRLIWSLSPGIYLRWCILLHTGSDPAAWRSRWKRRSLSRSKAAGRGRLCSSVTTEETDRTICKRSLRGKQAHCGNINKGNVQRKWNEAVKQRRAGCCLLCLRLHAHLAQEMQTHLCRACRHSAQTVLLGNKMLKSALCNSH